MPRAASENPGADARDNSDAGSLTGGPPTLEPVKGNCLMAAANLADRCRKGIRYLIWV